MKISRYQKQRIKLENKLCNLTTQIIQNRTINHCQYQCTVALPIIRTDTQWQWVWPFGLKRALNIRSRFLSRPLFCRWSFSILNTYFLVYFIPYSFGNCLWAVVIWSEVGGGRIFLILEIKRLKIVIWSQLEGDCLRDYGSLGATRFVADPMSAVQIVKVISDLNGPFH